MINKQLNYGLDVDINGMDILYRNDTIGPAIEIRKKKDITSSLMDPECSGPENVYSIAMDVYKTKDYETLVSENLLFGVVVYNKGKLGKEPIRSQGHKHDISESCKMSTGELYEVWSGKAIIYMQDSKNKISYAVCANKGEKVLVPPGWIHATISSDYNEELVFGAWCVRDYGFDYKEVRANKGIAHFPIYDNNNEIEWINNKNYEEYKLIIKKPRVYTEFNINDKYIYKQFEEDNKKFRFITRPCDFDFESFIP